MKTLHPKERPDIDILVDDDIYDRFKDWWWYLNPKGYVWSTLGGRCVLLHRLVMGVEKGSQIDHKDRNKLNNTRENLRVSSVAQNAWNRKANSRSSTGLRGVSPCKLTGQWRALIMANGKRHNLGRFATAEEAAHAWDKKAIELYGEFAQLNFPDFDYSNYEPKDVRKTKTSKYVGVSWCRVSNKWIACYYLNKQQVHLGKFQTAHEAAVAIRKSVEERCPERLAKPNYASLPLE